MRKKKPSFNDTHPELEEGEVFVTNIFPEISRIRSYYDEMRGGEKDDWESIGLKTKRAGEVAYDVNGRALSNGYPVFASKKEVDRNIRESKKSLKRIFGKKR